MATTNPTKFTYLHTYFTLHQAWLVLSWVTVREYGWLHGTAVECRSLVCELSLSCILPVADGWPFMCVYHPLWVNQPGQLSQSFLFEVNKSAVSGNWMSATSVMGGAIWWKITKERQARCNLLVKLWSMSQNFETMHSINSLYKYSSFPFLLHHLSM